MNPSDHLAVISTDGHCGADLLDYKPYLETAYHERFDAWAADFHDGWADIEANFETGNKLGLASFDSSLNWDSAQRLAWSQDQGIAAEVLFPNTAPPFSPSGAISAPGPRTSSDYELRFAGIRAHNRWLADFCSQAPGRRAGLAQVFLDPSQQVLDDAIAQARQARASGLRGILLPSDHTLRMSNLYYPQYDALWAVCEELDLPVHRHGIIATENAAQGGAASPWIASVEASFYGTRGIAHLICAGVFARFPAFTFVTTELPDAQGVPAFLNRLDAMYRAAVSGGSPGNMPIDAAVAQLKKLPSEYYAERCFLGAPLDMRAAAGAGAPNLMFGADIPHAEGTAPYTRAALRILAQDMSESQMRLMAGERAAKLYGFDLVALQDVVDLVCPTMGECQTPLTAAEYPRYPTDTRCRMFSVGLDPRTPVLL